MKKIIFFITITILLYGLIAAAENPAKMKFPPLKFEPIEPVRLTIDNGLIVYFLENHELPVVVVSAMFHGGTAYDSPDRIGLTELTARLLRTGGAASRTPDQVDEALDFVGASISSNASGDNLSLDLNLLKKDAPLGFEILSDMLQKPGFDTGKIALEVSNKKDEIRRQNDEPAGITRRVFYETVYNEHPYGYFPTLATMDNIKRDDIIATYRKFYNPDNCIMAVSGDLTIDEVKGFINKYFSGWPKGNITLALPPVATMQYKPGVYYAKKDINQANIRIGHLCMTDKNPDRHAMEVMNFALGGGGFTSRLMGQVRTSAGLAYNVGSYTYNRPLMGSFFAYCQTKSESMAEATSMILDIINKVKDSGITQEELDMAKESIVNSFVFNYTTPDQIVAARALLELNGFPPDQLKKDVEAYKAVTLADCKRVAAKYLDPINNVIVITGNKDTFDKPLDTFGPVTEVPMEIK